MNDYATVAEAEILWRPMTDAEKTRAEALIPIICSDLRAYAKKVGKDLDMIVAEDDDMARVAKSVVIDVLARTLMTSTDSEPMSQYSESALGYTTSGTFLVPGGGMFVKKSEYARLGLRNQRIGTMEFWSGDDD